MKIQSDGERGQDGQFLKRGTKFTNEYITYRIVFLESFSQIVNAFNWQINMNDFKFHKWGQEEKMLYISVYSKDCWE